MPSVGPIVPVVTSHDLALEKQTSQPRAVNAKVHRQCISVAISWANKWNRPSVTFQLVFQYPVTNNKHHLVCDQAIYHRILKTDVMSVDQHLYNFPACEFFRLVNRFNEAISQGYFQKFSYCIANVLLLSFMLQHHILGF